VESSVAALLEPVARLIAARLGTSDLDPGWGRLAPGTELRAGPPPLPRKPRARDDDAPVSRAT